MRALWRRFQVWLDEPAKKRQYFYAYLCSAAAILFAVIGFGRLQHNQEIARCHERQERIAAIHTVFDGVLDIITSDQKDPRIIATRAYLDQNLTPVQC